MQTQVNRKDFIAAVAAASRAVETHCSVPILHNVHIAANGRLEIAGTDQEVSIVSSCACATVADGEATLDAKLLQKILKGCAGDVVTVETLENNWVRLQAGRSEFKVVGLNAKEFPQITTKMPTDSMRLDGAVLRRMLDQTSYAISKDEMRANLSGLCLEVKDGKLILTATDGHRLASVSTPIDHADIPASILPSKFVKELDRIVRVRGVGVVELAVGLLPAQALTHKITVGKWGPYKRAIRMGRVFKCEDGSIVKRSDCTKVEAEEYTPTSPRTAYAQHAETLISGRCVEGEFPDYTQVIPTQSAIVVTVNADDLRETLKRVMLVASERTRGVKLDLGNGELNISAVHPDLGEACEALPTLVHSGPALAIGFNGAYIVDALDCLPEGAVAELKFQGDVNPMTITCDEVSGLVVVIMPMRVN